MPTAALPSLDATCVFREGQDEDGEYGLANLTDGTLTSSLSSFGYMGVCIVDPGPAMQPFASRYALVAQMHRDFLGRAVRLGGERQDPGPYPRLLCRRRRRQARPERTSSGELAHSGRDQMRMPTSRLAVTKALPA